MTTIQDVQVIVTAPGGRNLTVVKILTSEPGLYGLGCAAFCMRPLSVKTAVEEQLRPLLIGRDVARIEELFRLMMVHSYWRNGPVLNNAISGVDMALWDIKGKQAGMPLYDLLGGRYRDAAAVYRHADGKELSEVEDKLRKFVEQGVRHVRVQYGGYGGAALRETIGAKDGGPIARPTENALQGQYYDPRRYTRDTMRLLEHMRSAVGDDVELLHDVHERLTPAEAVEFAKEVEPFRLFFLEDLLAPEDIEWFSNVRAVCSTPLAMGELFCHPNEWTPLITGRKIDFMRMHISAMGGCTPARKAAVLGESHGVRTAWHGPPDVSPIGHAVNLHLDLVCPNFGIQEFFGFSDELKEIFPGCPELRGGYLYANDRPGIGIDLDETAAGRFPYESSVVAWTQARLPDGSLSRP